MDYDLSGSGTLHPGNDLGAVQILTGHQPVCPVIVHPAHADRRKRALGAAGERGRGKRLAALPRVKTHTAAYAE